MFINMRSCSARRALLVRMRTEQVPETAGDRFSLQVCRVEVARNQRLDAAHANWHE
jgi:hypothetical protein